MKPVMGHVCVLESKRADRETALYLAQVGEGLRRKLDVDENLPRKWSVCSSVGLGSLYQPCRSHEDRREHLMEHTASKDARKNLKVHVYMCAL